MSILAFFSACFLLLTASQSFAVTTVPTKMNFQGRLSDASGNIKPNGTYNMRLKLYTVNSGGSAVWSEDRLVSAGQGITVTNGLFSLKLGDVTTLPANLFASGELYLEVELPTPATATSTSPTWTEGAMSPRNQMLTSAYAYNSETLDGLDSAAFAQLSENNTFTGDTVFNGTLQGGSSLTLGTAGVAGSLIVSDGSSNTATIKVGALAGNYEYTIPVTTANDTFCLVTLANCGGAGGGDVYLANANTFTNANTIAKTSATAFRIQSDSGAATLFTADTSAMAVTINGDVSIASGKTITIVGGTTASRPVSPTEGMVYFDTDTDKLEVYSNGKWQADRTDVILVAASNSSQADKDAADYVADGNTGAALDGDQVQIQSALTAGSGKKVVLLAGTYVADATILIPNNTTFTGVGQGTVIEFADIDVNAELITNSDTTTGAGIFIQNMKLDGRDDLNTGFQEGITLNGVGGGSGASIRSGPTVDNVVTQGFSNSGFTFIDSQYVTLRNSTGRSSETGLAFYGIVQNSTISNNLFVENDGGMYLEDLRNSIITQNTFLAQTDTDIYADAISKSTISGNTFNSSQAMDIYYAVDTIIGGNKITAVFEGLNLMFGEANTIEGNRITGGLKGLRVYMSHRNNITNNYLSDTGGSSRNDAIVIESSDSNTIVGNTITDTSATTANYSIDIMDSLSENNYLAGNTLGTGSINNAGTGTIYAGQLDSSGNFRLQPAGTVELQKNTNVTGTLQATGNITASSGTVTIGTTSVAGNLVISDGSSNTATIKVGALAGNYEYTIPVTTANDTFCMVTLANCSGVATVGTYSTTNTSATGATISGTTITFQDASATAPGMVGTGTQTFAGNKTFSGELKVSKSSSSVQVALLQVEQTGSGDTTLELKNAAGSSYYLGMDQSAGGLFRIGSSTSARVNNTVGTTTIGGSTIPNVNSQIIAKKVTTGPSVSGSLSSIAVYLSAVDATNPGIKVGLYSHDAGNNRPNALIVGLDVSTNASVGWNVLPISTSISASTTYWIASNVEGASTSVDYAYCGGCGGSSASYYPMSFGNTWPSSLGVPNSTGTDEDYSFYMNVASGSVTDTFAGTKLFAISDTGETTLQNSVNSASAFEIQNASGTSLFIADTSSSRIRIGSASADTTGTVLVLDTKSDSGDPTGVAGAMYYNSNAGKFRCYQGAAWTDCIGAGGTTTLQDAYNSSASPALITTTAAKGVQIVAGAVPTTDLLTIGNASFPTVTNNTNGLKVNYAGGAAAVEGAGIRIDHTPGTTAGGTWSGLRIVSAATGPVSGVTSYGLKIEGPSSPGAGTEIGLRVASGFDIGLDIASGGLQLSAMSDPSTPSAGNLRVYAKTNGGRTMLKVKSASGVDYSLQPFFGTNKIGMIQPAGGAASCTVAPTNAIFGLLPIFLNYSATTANANTCPRPVANTNFFTAMRRSGVTTSTAAGTLAGMRSSGTANLYFRGDAADRGGFYVVGRVGVATHVAGKRMFAGMNTSFAAPTNVEPSSVFNILGIGCDAADTNLQFMHNDASGAATKIDLGANYPCNTSGTDMYEYRMYSPPNGSEVYYSVSRLNTTDFVEGSANTNIPTNTTMLNNQIWISNNATAAAASLDIASFYIETDN